MARKSSTAWLGVASGRRAWTWIITPPSSTIRRASAAYSAGVYGIAGHWSRWASAPEIAHVMVTGSSRLTGRGRYRPNVNARPEQGIAAAYLPTPSAERTSHDRSDHPRHRRRIPPPPAHAGPRPDGLLRDRAPRPRRRPGRLLHLHRPARDRRQRQVRSRRPDRCRDRRDDPARALPRVPRAARRPRHPLRTPLTQDEPPPRGEGSRPGVSSPRRSRRRGLLSGGISGAGALAVVAAGVGPELAAGRAARVLAGVDVRVPARRVLPDRAHDARLRRHALPRDARARALERVRPDLQVDHDRPVDAGRALVDMGGDGLRAEAADRHAVARLAVAELDRERPSGARRTLRALVAALHRGAELVAAALRAGHGCDADRQADQSQHEDRPRQSLRHCHSPPVRRQVAVQPLGRAHRTILPINVDRGRYTGTTALRFHGRSTVLPSAISSARQMTGRVSRGSMTSSIIALRAGIETSMTLR